MFIINKKNIVKGMMLVSLSLSLSLAACFSSTGGFIDKEDIGVRRAVNEQAPTEELQSFLEQNKDKINVVERPFPDGAVSNTKYASPDCKDEDMNKFVISDEGSDSKVDIYVGGSIDSETRNKIYACGVKGLKNKVERSSVGDESLINEIAKYTSGEALKAFYDENQDMIQVDLREIGVETSPSTLSVFRDKLRIEVEGDRYIVGIDSRLEENVKAHLLAHALTIIEIETNEGNRGIVDQKVDLDFSTVQQLYYGNNNGALISQLNLNSGENRDETQVIAAFYFYSRFHSYSTNQALKQAGLELEQDLSNESISDEIIVDLETRKNLTTDTSYFEELVVGKGFAEFMDVLLNIEPLPIDPIDLESLNNIKFYHKHLQ